MGDLPPFPSQPYVDPGTPIPPLLLGNRPDASPKHGIVLALTAIPECIAIEGQEAAHPSLTEPKALGAPLRRRSLRLGPSQFFALMAFNTWMSSACSATIYVSRRCWSSSWRSFFTSLTSSPAYWSATYKTSRPRCRACGRARGLQCPTGRL
jgi:hypothetical protein